MLGYALSGDRLYRRTEANAMQVSWCSSKSTEVSEYV